MFLKLVKKNLQTSFQGEFEVYWGGELLLEFTPQNTDSASLETLRYIYDAAREKNPPSPRAVEKTKNRTKNRKIMGFNFIFPPVK
jgi:hypothetical protein